MKTRALLRFTVLAIVVLIALPSHGTYAAQPIVIGAPLSTAFLYGWDAEKGMRLAIEEINAKGGVNVKGVKRPFEMVVIDTRDLEPGVPVSEALLVVEKLILENKADFIVGGPVRSEAALVSSLQRITRVLRKTTTSINTAFG